MKDTKGYVKRACTLAAIVITVLFPLSAFAATTVVSQLDSSHTWSSYGSYQFYNGVNFNSAATVSATQISYEFYSQASGSFAENGCGWGVEVYDFTTNKIWYDALTASQVTDLNSGTMVHISGIASTTSAQPINAGDTIHVQYCSSTPGSNSGQTLGDSSGNPYISLIADPPPVDNSTRIISVSPSNGQEIATTSLPWDFETTGVVSSNDFQTGTILRIQLSRNTSNQSPDALVAFANFKSTDIPIASTGGFDVSSTTVANAPTTPDGIGIWTMKQSIMTPGIGVHWWIFNWNLSYNTLAATSTSFLVGTTTSIDKLTLGSQTYQQAVQNSTKDQLAECQFDWWDSAVDFSLGGKLLNCMGAVTAYMILPPDNLSIADTVSTLQTGVLARWPWGYVTRMVSIMTDTTATTTISSWTASVPTSASTTLDFTYDPGDMIAGAGALLDNIHANGTSLTFKDIFRPWLDLFLAISVLIIVFTDMAAMGNHRHMDSNHRKPR